MRISKLRLEHGLFLLILLIVLFFRLPNLGTTSLNDDEAALALQALNVSRGEPVSFGSQPGYVLLTGALFWIFGASNFTARIISAMSIILLIAGLYTLRDICGRKQVLIAAFALAVDPGMVAISRIAGGPALSLLSFMIIITAYLKLRSVWFGVGVALLLFSGPFWLHGLIIILAVWGMYWLFIKKFPRSSPPSDISTLDNHLSNEQLLHKAIFATILAGVVGGTLFFLIPGGMSTWVTGFTSYLAGWATPSGISGLRLLSALVIYQPLGLLFAIIGAVKAWKGDGGSEAWTYRVLSFGTVIALLVVWLYPGRQMGDLVWVILPLYLLASFVIPDFLKINSADKWLTFLQTVSIVVLSATFWQQLTSLVQSPPGARINMQQLIIQTPEAPLYLQRLSLFLAIISLLVLVNIMVVLSRSWHIARPGIVWGVVIVLGSLTLSSTWHSSHLPTNNEYLSTYELWEPLPSQSQQDLFVKTISDLSQWRLGERNAIPILSTVDTPSLRWILRDFHNAAYSGNNQDIKLSASAKTGDLPLVVLTTPEQEVPSLAASYRGQDFNWRLLPGWAGQLPDDISKWLVTRRVDWRKEYVILWARSDVFPGGSLDSSLQPQTDEQDTLDQIAPIK